MKEQAEKAFKEMLEISTDLDKAVLYSGEEAVVSNFPDGLQATMVKKAKELSAAGAVRAASMGSAPLTQMVVESAGGTVFLVHEPQDDGLGMLATAKKDSRIGLVFYDLKTCIRDAQEVDEEPIDEEPIDEGPEADAGAEVEA
ncbi:MAG TPA: hypothetical protein VFD74_09105 [Thermoleophilia bacterium]|nr:hypothetical protein [Thermoleophilia bacterium]